jgi:hypothetical protein
MDVVSMASHSREELEAAAGRIFHNIVQLFGYYAWIAKVAPALKAQDNKVTERLYFNVAQNAVVDGYLINLRRLNEFFSRPPKDGKERDDDLRAYILDAPTLIVFSIRKTWRICTSGSPIPLLSRQLAVSLMRHWRLPNSV